MDPMRNPYTPRSGSRPPVLAGRDQQLAAFRTLLGQLREDQPAKCLLVTGLHSVGKTVLLTVFEGMAEDAGFRAAAAEVTRSTAFAGLVARLVRRALLSLGDVDRPTPCVRQAARLLKAFSMRVPGGIEVRANADAAGCADTGRLGDDIADLFVALGQAAIDHGNAVVFLLDEIQLIRNAEFGALVNALHRCGEHHLPITVIGAGLPQLPVLTGSAKSEAAEMFDFAFIERLPDAEARAALEEPAEALGAALQPEATKRIIRLAHGYPYFLQEYGKRVWNLAQGRTITVADVEAAYPIVQMHLDDNFFRAYIARATAVEVAYLRSMADLEPAPYRSGEIAARLGRQGPEAVAPVRSRLIEKGLIYSPRYGLNEFAVPDFADFLRRNYSFDMMGAR